MTTQDGATPFDVNKVLSRFEKELDPMAVPGVKPGGIIGAPPDEVTRYAPPAVRVQLRKEQRESMLDTLASLLVRLTYIDMITFCRGIVLDDAAEVVKLADQIHEWAAENSKE